MRLLTATILATHLSVVAFVAAHAIPRNVTSQFLAAGDLSKELQRRAEKDATDFTWVKRFAAIGDSYTAGVGAGSQLGELGDWWCSRYDQSYPVLIKEAVGSKIEDFQYPACFGDQTGKIYNQALALKDNIDFLTLTAGGNDLCLSDIIKNCVVLAFDGEATCTAILEQAQKNLDSIVKDNIKQILKALDSKMAKDGIVVYNGYARFFNEENEDCATKQDWAPFYWYRYLKSKPDPLTLTVERRKKFNKLTLALNTAIREVVEEVAKEVKYKLGFADWDLWGIEGVKGQMCDPSSTGKYPDDKQPGLLFFKPDTRKTAWRLPIKRKRLTRGHGRSDAVVADLDGTVDGEVVGEWDMSKPPDEAQLEALRASLPPPPAEPERDLDDHGVERAVYRSSLWTSVNPAAAALHALDARAPAPPGCPGDARPLVPNVGWILPDFFGRIFHPNEAGQNAMASFAVERAMRLRAEVLGVNAPVCSVTEEFRCWRNEGRRAYATADRLNANYKIFCDEAEASGDEGWRVARTFHKGTPDEHEFVVEATEDASGGFNRHDCHESMEKIINGCEDGGQDENPLHWKFGGTWKRGEVRYSLDAKRNNRPWPPIKEPHGVCHGTYGGLFSQYQLSGAGWSSWDHGQETILPKAKGCMGLGISSYRFTYFDEPDSQGMEWYVAFETPVFVMSRCFRNEKIAKGAGGATGGCSGSSLA